MIVGSALAALFLNLAPFLWRGIFNLRPAFPGGSQSLSKSVFLDFFMMLLAFYFVVHFVSHGEEDDENGDPLEYVNTVIEDEDAKKDSE
jgi:hypothetical protein